MSSCIHNPNPILNAIDTKLQNIRAIYSLLVQIALQGPTHTRSRITWAEDHNMFSLPTLISPYKSTNPRSSLDGQHSVPASDIIAMRHQPPSVRLPLRWRRLPHYRYRHPRLALPPLYITKPLSLRPSRSPVDMKKTSWKCRSAITSISGITYGRIRRASWTRCSCRSVGLWIIRTRRRLGIRYTCVWIEHLQGWLKGRTAEVPEGFKWEQPEGAVRLDRNL